VTPPQYPWKPPADSVAVAAESTAVAVGFLEVESYTASGLLVSNMGGGSQLRADGASASERTRGDRPKVAVLGGAVGGLAAAERFREFATVDLYERQHYDEKRVNCGEAINEGGLVPLEKTPENGFLNRVSGFEVEVYATTDRDPDAEPLTTPRIAVEDGYVTDRDTVEQSWARRLGSDERVTIHEGTTVTSDRYHDLRAEYDYLIDATGQPSVTARASDAFDRSAYTGDIVALNADVEGDFSAAVEYPRIVFEGYLGYFWVFPKSADRANVGIGWSDESRPDDYMAALWSACDRAGVPRPDRETTNVYTIPKGPSLDPTYVNPEPGVFLVGDAAGIANRYQGEGICQAIRSSYLLADLVQQGREDDYPVELYASMRSEYRLATLMRGVLVESGDPRLMGRVAEAIDGLTVEDVTRRPRRVYRRLLAHPRLLADLLSVPGLRRRLYEAYTDRWEFGRAPTSSRL
jgi:digeranylgeranylglycerophospholipid reductase